MSPPNEKRLKPRHPVYFAQTKNPTWLPATHYEMHERLGLRNAELKNIKQVQDAQAQIGDWMIRAAEVAGVDSSDIRAVWEHARTFWGPNFESLCAALVEAENAILRDQPAMA